MSRTGHSLRSEILASVALLFLCAAAVFAQNTSAASAEPSFNSLTEIANKRNVLLMVKRVSIVDASGGREAMIEEVLRADPRTSRRYRSAYNTIAGKLNRFMKKHKGLSAVGRIEEADYIIFFNLLEYRWPLGTPYPYGELFVIVKSQMGARIIWKSKKVQWAGDAADDFLNDLRLIHGEK